VLCVIGARVSWDDVADMFDRAGYEAELVWVSVKAQQQPEDVLSGYHRCEQATGREFRFLDLNQLAADLTADRSVTLAQLQTWMGDPAIGRRATQALQEHQRTTIGHGVYFVLGRVRYLTLCSRSIALR
jgi:hypothetical protein